MDEYKAKILKEILEEMQQEKHYLCRLKGDNTASINLAEDAIKILIEFYSEENNCSQED